MSELESKPSDQLQKLHALVLDGYLAGGDSLLWSTEQSDWLRRSPWGGFAKQEVDTGSEDYRLPEARPTSEGLAAADALVKRLEGDRMCQHCGHASLSLHGVAPDVFGDPQLVCLLRPDPRVVSSFGGGGRRKHWGSPYACDSVRSRGITAPGEWVSKYGRYLFGEPLTALEVFSMPWCSKCQDAAWRIRARLTKALTEALGREPSTSELTQAFEDEARPQMQASEIRQLLDDLRDRTQEELVSEMRELFRR